MWCVHPLIAWFRAYSSLSSQFIRSFGVYGNKPPPPKDKLWGQAFVDDFNIFFAQFLFHLPSHIRSFESLTFFMILISKNLARFVSLPSTAVVSKFYYFSPLPVAYTCNIQCIHSQSILFDLKQCSFRAAAIRRWLPRYGLTKDLSLLSIFEFFVNSLNCGVRTLAPWSKTGP